MSPGVYPGLSMAEYLAIPAVNSGVLRAMVDRCPRAAWFESWLNPARVRETSDEMDVGTIAHSILLEGSRECVAVIDPQDHPADKTGNIPEGWTNKSIRAARDAARAAGKIPVLPKDLAAIEGMVASIQTYIDGLRSSEPAIWQAFQPGGGDSELTCVWQDGDALCRIRPDRISADRTLIADLKMTAASAAPESWSRQLLRMGYATGAGFYRRGVKALFGVEDCAYVYVVCECEPPYLCSLVGLDPTWIAYGDARVRIGLDRWRECARVDRWPGYPTRVAYPELPGWLQVEDPETDRHGIPYDLSKLFGEPREVRT